MKDIKPL